jgi:Family of unknown function (DUF6492)
LKHDISFITPSYRRDFARSTLLFESMDDCVRNYETHYVIVNDEDYSLFAPHHRGRREILRASQFLPAWLHRMPSLIRWRGRRYMWSLRARPVYGWHTQQLVKIAAVATLPEARYCLIDSDCAFFRPFDMSVFAAPNPVPLLVERQAIPAGKPRHSRWVGAAAELLGVEAQPFPADDYIGTMIVWNQATVRGMISRIESVTGRDWAEALCRAHSFSECLIYGSFVQANDAERARHELIVERYCRVHWERQTPDRAGILALLRACTPEQVALCIQSFNETPLDLIRGAIASFNAGHQDTGDLVGASPGR